MTLKNSLFMFYLFLFSSSYSFASGLEKTQVFTNSKQRELEIAEQEMQELTLKQKTLEQVEKRRAEYEATGKVPAVPPELAQNIPREDLQFGGYADAANDQEVEAAALKRSNERPGEESEEIDDIDTPSNPNDFGVFVNSGGEIWHWRPEDQGDKRMTMISNGIIHVLSVIFITEITNPDDLQSLYSYSS